MVSQLFKVPGLKKKKKIIEGIILKHWKISTSSLPLLAYLYFFSYKI